jgi:hypothetical protein
MIRIAEDGKRQLGGVDRRARLGSRQRRDGQDVGTEIPYLVV